jgi:Uri superfamily endonuclease
MSRRAAVTAPKAPGVYAVVFSLESRLSVVIAGRPMELNPGVYLYVGSALGPGGLRSRISRHVERKVQKPRWHIDRLTISNAYKPLASVWCTTTMRLEPYLALMFKSSRLFEPVGIFGSSDDRFKTSHLFLCKTSNIYRCTLSALSVFMGLNCVPWADVYKK